MWPIGELILYEYLTPLMAARVVTELPADLAGQVPLVRVHQVPGGDADRSQARPLLDIECFAADRLAVWSLTGRMQDALYRLPGRYRADFTVDEAELDSGPGLVPYKNTDVRRTVTTYRLTCRALV